MTRPRARPHARLRPGPHTRLRDRLRSGGPDAGMAMASVLLAILITAGLSILVLGMLVSQVVPTQVMQAGSRTVFAAEAGANAVLAQIRTADGTPDASGAVYGDRTKLPCTAQGPVDGAGAGLTFTATVSYFTEDPKDRPDLVPLGCTPGAGPLGDPTFAVVTSRGRAPGVAGVSAGSGDRTVSVVYEFTVTNVNVPGGLIYSYDAAIAPDRFCLQADSAGVGSTVSYVGAALCGTDDSRQMWVYDTDYAIKLASTTLPASATGPLCLTGPVTESANELVTLQTCKAPSVDRWNQLWSWEGGARWRGQKKDIEGGYSSVFLSSGTNSGSPAGRQLWVSTQGASNAEWGSFNPDARVGAGAAGYATRQIVSYLEFGRCFDVTDQKVSSTYMIVYPCKQDPTAAGTNLLWNHKWFYTEPAPGTSAAGPQTLWVLNGNSTSDDWCLRSPNTEGGFVTLVSECVATDLAQQWTRYGDTGSYASSYTFVDAWGRCISIGPVRYKNAFSTLVTRNCDFSLAQKWNAPPGTEGAKLERYREVP